MTEIICTFITAAASIIVAVLSIHIKRSNDKADHRAELRERESLLNLRLTSSAVKLAIVSANALMQYKNNGNVEEAYDAAREAEEEYQKFLQEVTAHEVGK